MKIHFTDDRKTIGYNAVTDTAVILTEDKDRMKELARSLRGTNDKSRKQREERKFHDEMASRYGKTVAGELLFRLWTATKEIYNDEENLH